MAVDWRIGWYHLGVKIVLDTRAVQISGLVDPETLILLDKRVPHRHRRNQVGGEGLIPRGWFIRGRIRGRI
jgi:hypothetical protein